MGAKWLQSEGKHIVLTVRNSGDIYAALPSEQCVSETVFAAPECAYLHRLLTLSFHLSLPGCCSGPVGEWAHGPRARSPDFWTRPATENSSGCNAGHARPVTESRPRHPDRCRVYWLIPESIAKTRLSRHTVPIRYDDRSICGSVPETPQ